MTEHEWLTCDNPEPMLRTGKALREERRRIFAMLLESQDWLEKGGAVYNYLLRELMRRCHLRAGNIPWRKQQADIIRCLVPYRRVKFRKLRTEAVLGLARGIEADQAFERMPILADALEENGCCDPLVLEHCRYGKHVRGCWVISALLS